MHACVRAYGDLLGTDYRTVVEAAALTHLDQGSIVGKKSFWVKTEI